jgi:hypothetical protein
MPTVVGVKDFPTCNDDANEVTLLSFCRELRQFHAKQKYHSLQSLYELLYGIQCKWQVRFSSICGFGLSIMKEHLDKSTKTTCTRAV